MDESRNESERVAGRLDEKMLSALVGGVFWFTWLTSRYRQAANMAAQVEGQRPELN
jgi:hypothetical protein